MPLLRIVAVFAFVLAVAGCDSGVPPAGNYATVSGRVTEAGSGRAIPGASVVVNGVLSAKTDTEGNFKISPVPTGPWSYSVDAGEKFAAANSDVEAPLTPGEQRNFPISLKHR